ncbi:hypothetical protein [Streptomyces azureus]|uniref:hypothetical protein n=1 Tax=Streptomyces azureus TaxID=146537 RepID=UPI003C2F5C25
MAAHNPSEGRVTIHPTPGTDSTLTPLAYDILAALGKPVPLTGYPASDPRPAWTLCAAWILALPITCLTVLRAHLLDPRCLGELMALRARTGLRLALVCHHRKTPAVLERALSRTDHQLADADAVLSYGEAAGESEDSPPAALSRRWINLPALTTLQSIDDSDRCSCRAPTASERGFTPPALTPLAESQIARRLHAATAHPHLAAELATACVTAASMTQLDTARVTDAALDASTLMLHDRRNTRQGCMTHSVPDWARPLIRAAMFTHFLTTGSRSDRLFTDPLGSTGLPRLTDFAEQCKLRPPQPPRPKRSKNTRQKSPPPTVWPLSNAHHSTSWYIAEEDMRGCPQPSGYRKRERVPHRMY